MQSFCYFFMTILGIFISGISAGDASDPKALETGGRALTRKDYFHERIAAFRERLALTPKKWKQKMRKRRGASGTMLWNDADKEAMQQIVESLPSNEWPDFDIIYNYLAAVTGGGSDGSDGSNNKRGGVTRRLRLWCRSGIGYHIEINKGGKVVARHQKSPNGEWFDFILTNGEFILACGARVFFGDVRTNEV